MHHIEVHIKKNESPLEEKKGFQAFTPRSKNTTWVLSKLQLSSANMQNLLKLLGWTAWDCQSNTLARNEPTQGFHAE